MITLSDVTELIVDSEHKTAPKVETGHPLVRTSDIKRGRIDLSNVQRVSEETYEQWTRRAVPQAGDLILAREAPVGNVAVVTDGMNPVLGQRTVLLRPDRTCVDPTYLCALLLGDEAQYWMNAVANGATVPHLNMSDIRAMRLPELPDLETQRRTGAAIASFDDLVENNQRQIEILEEMARLLYREWFVHFRFPGHEEVDLVDSELGAIPKGWEARRLGDVAEWFSGGTPSTKNPDFWDGDIPWITSGSLTSFQLTTSDRRLTEAGVDSGSRLVPRDTTLFVVRGMSLAKEFRHGIADVPLAFGQDCKALIAVDELHPLVLAYGVSAIASDVQAMVEYAAHGTGKLSTDRLQALPFLIPDPVTQDHFARAAGPMRDLVSTLVTQNGVLREARDLLLPRLVSGELDVSELDLAGVLA